MTRYFIIDWADHIRPVARGGLSTLENGVCASWSYNSEKRDKTDVPPFLFFEGRPAQAGQKLEPSMRRYLERQSRLHHSDWYFNRALFRLLLGVDYLDNGVGVRSRDDKYYASAALKAAQKWRQIVFRESVATLEERGLVLPRPSRGHQLLLSVREATSVADLLRIMRACLPIYRRT